VHKLLQDEHELRVAREHWSVFVPSLAGCALGIAATAWLLSVAPDDVSGHSLSSLKQLVLLGVTAGALLTLTTRWLRWRYTTFMLTDRRVVVSSGVLSRRTESIALDRVQDIAVRQSLAARIFHVGDIEIESAGRDGSEVLAQIHDPQGFSNVLLTAVEANRTGRPYRDDAPSPGAPSRGAMPAEPSGYGTPPRRDGL
jgi:membrane protein YdbS with pleckstrin-like domain